MKLHAFNVQRAMTKPHDYSVVSAGRDLKTIGQPPVFNDQRMITAGAEVLIDLRKNCFAIVPHPRRFAVKEFGRAENSAAKHLADRLMTETDAENGHSPAETLDNFH